MSNIIKSSFLFVLATILVSCKDKKEESTSSTDETVSVRIAEIQSQNAAEAVVASGIIASSNEARLAFKTGGIIAGIFVKEGDQVKKGQLLAQLNLTEINAQVNSAKEAFSKMERDRKRVENLFKDSVATLEQFQNIQTAFNVAKQNLDIAKFNQNFSEIRATTHGRIIKKIMNESELIGPGMPVFYLSSDGAKDWVIKVAVSDKDWVRLVKGDQASVAIDAFKAESFTAVVSNKAPSIDPQSGLYPIDLTFTRLPTQMALGLFATVKIQPAIERKYLTIPIDAVIEGNGNHAFVFVADQGKARKLNIETAGIKDGFVLVSGGLAVGQKVITDGSAYLKDGSMVKIVN
ncbi:MAG: efflux RND transporter periplasmic adaptor subunit [Saprospiraceae bacterium]